MFACSLTACMVYRFEFHRLFAIMCLLLCLIFPYSSGPPRDWQVAQHQYIHNINTLCSSHKAYCILPSGQALHPHNVYLYILPLERILGMVRVTCILSSNLRMSCGNNSKMHRCSTGSFLRSEISSFLVQPIL